MDTPPEHGRQIVMADEFSEKDLQVNVYQHGIPGVNYYCAVRITHLPTGIEASASVPPLRSQIEAKAKCLEKLRERVPE